MAKQVINNGAVPNDGTGESLYSATSKINENFTELYSLTAGGGDITFVNSITAGSGITVNNATGDITLTNSAPYIPSFTSLAVIGQDSLISSRSATMTFIAGSNVSITTDAASNRITIAASSQVLSDWNATTGLAVISNKPTIPTDVSQLTDVGGTIITQSRLGDFLFDGASISTSTLTGIDIVSQTSSKLSWTDSTGETQSNVLVDSTGLLITNLATVGVNLYYTEWRFDIDGRLRLPNAVALKASTDPVVCPPTVETIFYSTVESTISTIKLTVTVEGVYASASGLDTHSCDIMIAKAALNDVVRIIEYGTIYTCAGPLATFAATWNPTAFRVEVTCQPTSATNEVRVRSFATEITTTDV